MEVAYWKSASKVAWRSLNYFLHISSILVKIKLHSKNQLPRLHGVVVVGGWSYQLLFHSQLELRLSWAVTIPQSPTFTIAPQNNFYYCYTDILITVPPYGWIALSWVLAIDVNILIWFLFYSICFCVVYLYYILSFRYILLCSMYKMFVEKSVIPKQEN